MIFNYNRARLAQFTIEGAKDMMNTDLVHWSRVYMKLESNYDSVGNNMCESFNNYILLARYPSLFLSGSDAKLWSEYKKIDGIQLTRKEL